MSEPIDVFGLASDVLVWEFIFLAFLSLGVGVLGGFVGLALGTMRLPALLFLGMPAPLAAGTNIMVSTLSAATGMVRHLRQGRVDLRMVVVMGVPSMIGALIGGLTSGRLPETLLISLAGGFVAWQGVELIVRARREGRPQDSERRESSGAALSTSGAFSPSRVTAEAGIGLSVGLLGGAVGLILGSIRLPALVRILRIDPRIAAGTNLFIGFLAGSLGWLGHVTRGNVDYPLLVGMGAAGMVGTYYGARLTGRVSLSTLVLTMGWVLLGRRRAAAGGGVPAVRVLSCVIPVFPRYMYDATITKE